MSTPKLIRRAALAATLQRALIFNGLPEDDLLRIAGYARLRSLDKGEILFYEGGKVEGFYVVVCGLIKAYRIGEGGREQLIHLVHPDESFAEPAIAGLPGYPAHTKALEKTEVALIPAEDFLEHLRGQSDLALRMLTSLSRHLHELVGIIESYKLRDSETRLLHWLLQQCDPDASESVIHLAISKGVLAAELGTRPETLSRIFAKLRNSGDIIVKGREIHVPDIKRLHALLESQLKADQSSRLSPK